MRAIKEITRLPFDRLDTWVFAGGGNRCWWQAGAVRYVMDAGVPLPAHLIGTSAGAGVAASLLVDRTETALQACQRLYRDNPKIFDWSSLRRRKLTFAHQRIYPAWVDAFLNADSFTRLGQSSSRLTVALTRPARFLGTRGSVAAGTLAYLVDKYLWNSIHPRLPRWLGLRQDFVALNDCADIESAQNLLVAAASAPPIMSARAVGSAQAIDGGYTDNAPIPAQTEDERSRTLVLLTRHYPRLPSMFTWLHRTYWQPSQRVPVSTWDCTPRTPVHDAYALGVKDAARALRGGLIR